MKVKLTGTGTKTDYERKMTRDTSSESLQSLRNAIKFLEIVLHVEKLFERLIR